MTVSHRQTESSASPISVSLYSVQPDAFYDEKVREYLCDMIAPALRPMEERYSPEHIIDECSKGNMQMWLAAAEGEGFHENRAAMVTEILEYPRRRVCSVLFLAGEKMESWLHLYRELEHWAIQNGCSEIEVLGRKGWERVMGQFGFKHCYTALTKEI